MAKCRNNRKRRLVQQRAQRALRPCRSKQVKRRSRSLLRQRAARAASRTTRERAGGNRAAKSPANRVHSKEPQNLEETPTFTSDHNAQRPRALPKQAKNNKTYITNCRRYWKRRQRPTADTKPKALGPCRSERSKNRKHHDKEFIV